MLSPLVKVSDILQNGRNFKNSLYCIPASRDLGYKNVTILGLGFTWHLEMELSDKLILHLLRLSKYFVNLCWNLIFNKLTLN